MPTRIPAPPGSQRRYTHHLPPPPSPTPRLRAAEKLRQELAKERRLSAAASQQCTPANPNCTAPPAEKKPKYDWVNCIDEVSRYHADLKVSAPEAAENRALGLMWEIAEEWVEWKANTPKRAERKARLWEKIDKMRKRDMQAASEARVRHEKNVERRHRESETKAKAERRNVLVGEEEVFVGLSPWEEMYVRTFGDVLGMPLFLAESVGDGEVWFEYEGGLWEIVESEDEEGDGEEGETVEEGELAE